MNFKNLLIGAASGALMLGAMVGPMAAFAKKTPPPTRTSVVNLGTSGNFVILAKTGITTTGVTKITGDMGVSPIAASAITGFGLTMGRSGQFSTSTLVNGKVYAADYKVPTPNMLNTAVGDMQTAYTDAAGRAPTYPPNLYSGNLGGRTLTSGVYKWTTGVTIPTDVTLSGRSNDVWIFQIAGTLDISPSHKVILSGDARAKNVFWQVAGVTNLGSASVFNGVILDKTAVTMQSGAVLNGKALAQTNVTLIGNTVKKK